MKYPKMTSAQKGLLWEFADLLVNPLAPDEFVILNGRDERVAKALVEKGMLMQVIPGETYSYQVSDFGWRYLAEKVGLEWASKKETSYE